MKYFSIDKESGFDLLSVEHVFFYDSLYCFLRKSFVTQQDELRKSCGEGPQKQQALYRSNDGTDTYLGTIKKSNFRKLL
jgi:hypothetical protein